MPKQPNPFLRTFLTTALVLGACAVGWAVYKSSKPGTVATPAQTSQTTGLPAVTGQPVQQGAASVTPAPATTPDGSQAPAQPAQGAPTSIPVPPADWSLAALVYASDAGVVPAPVGELAKDGKYALQAEFSNGGAGLKSLRLSRHFTSIKETENIQVQGELPIAQGQQFSALVPFAALAVEVTPPAAPGTTAKPISVNLYANTAGPIWRSVQPGQFEATVVDQANQPVLRLTRTYMLSENSYTLRVAQSVNNLSAYPLTVRFFQMGPMEMPIGDTSYGGDKRRVRFGYLLPPNQDPTQAQVVSGDYVLTHSDVLGSRDDAGAFAEKVMWPNKDSREGSQSLVWVGTTDRYYGIAAHPLAAPEATGEAKTFRWVDSVTRVVADGGKGAESVGLRLDSKPFALGPTGSATAAADMSMGAFAGPMDKSVLTKDPLSKSMGLVGLIIFTFGGPCAVCTFPVVTQGILGLLHVLHDYVLKDWSLAIICLVIVVRTILHPVTKWSQVKMARFGKQMQGLAPKQKEINEKYKDDPKKMQGEMARLWREEGVSPTGMLGCIPMFLQMPIWIALSATLYFAVELRHQGAFYGVFQKIQPHGSPFWQFLGDLAEPDRLLYAGHTLFTVPILGPISSLNILPLLLGIVFFMQQKYIQQPTAAQTPEQEMQMKMMKWMSVIMFPLFMYNAPAGLSLYFTVNSTFAILESKWIRAHMDKHGLLDLEKMKAQRQSKQKAKGGKDEGFMARLQRAVEERSQNATRDTMKRKK